MSKKDNSKKSKQGHVVKEAMKHLLDSLIDKKEIQDYQANFRVSDPNLNGKDHFSIDFKINFEDNSTWIIHSTNSIRSDRVKGILYTVSNIRRILPDIEKAYLVYPDTHDQITVKTADNLSKKIHNKEMHLILNDIISFRALTTIISTKSLNNSYSNGGSYYAKRGFNFEKMLVDVFIYPENLQKWNELSSPLVGFSFDWFFSLLTSFGYREEQPLEYIKASNIVPKLPSGGLPKTDIIVKVKAIGKPATLHTLSCKRSNKKQVSIHEYRAEDFIKVLNIKETPLKEALLSFQKHGGIRALKKEDPEAVEILNSLLPLYNNKLIEWAYFGLHGTEDRLQKVDFLVTLDQHDILSTYEREQFIKEQLQDYNIKQFNTPFSWTYPSKMKTERIQLKGSI